VPRPGEELPAVGLVAEDLPGRRLRADELALHPDRVAVDLGSVQVELRDVLLVPGRHVGGRGHGLTGQQPAEALDARGPAAGEAGGAMMVVERVVQDEDAAGAVRPDLPAEVVRAPGEREELRRVDVDDPAVGRATEGDLGAGPQLEPGRHPPVRRQPGVDLGERSRAERVAAALGVGPVSGCARPPPPGRLDP
jgi:hypothetical protein